MTTHKLIAMLTIAAAFAVPSTAMAEVVLGDRVYPEHKRAELTGACQGLRGKAIESLTEREQLDEESGDPASDWRLSGVSFTVQDCKDAGLI
jgi:hypothetical protein